MRMFRCAVCGELVQDRPELYTLGQPVPTCPHCFTEDMLMEVQPVVVTRHAALVEYLAELGVVPQGTPVVSHATPADVQGRHVYGVLPMHLAAEAALVTEVPLALPAELRGQELSMEQVRQYAGKPVTYRITRV